MRALILRAPLEPNSWAVRSPRITPISVVRDDRDAHSYFYFLVFRLSVFSTLSAQWAERTYSAVALPRVLILCLFGMGFQNKRQPRLEFQPCGQLSERHRRNDLYFKVTSTGSNRFRRRLTRVPHRYGRQPNARTLSALQPLIRRRAKSFVCQRPASSAN